jgi:hypothetical protein
MNLFLRFRFYILGAVVLIALAAAALWITMRPGNTNITLQNTATETPVFVRPTRVGAIAQLTDTPTPSATPAPRPTNSPTVLPSPTQLPSATSTSAPTATATAMIVPTQSAVNPGSSTQPTQSLPAVYGFTLLYLTQPATAGVNAQATIQTVRGASCTISVYMPGENFSIVNALPTLTAGMDGVCSWVWQVGTNTKRGLGFVRISANGMSMTYNFQVN